MRKKHKKYSGLLGIFSVLMLVMLSAMGGMVEGQADAAIPSDAAAFESDQISLSSRAFFASIEDSSNGTEPAEEPEHSVPPDAGDTTTSQQTDPLPNPYALVPTLSRAKAAPNEPEVEPLTLTEEFVSEMTVCVEID